jgi:hypothetical protein
MNKVTKKKAVFICAQKGGTGKSTVARAIVDHIRTRGGDDNKVAAFDADPKVGQLAQFYGIRSADGELDPAANFKNWKEGVISFDIRDKDAIPIMADALDLGANYLVFDMPGGSIDDMKEVFGSMETFLAEYEKEGYEVWVFVVITPMLASSNNINSIVGTFGPNTKYVAVKNLGFGDESSFEFFDGSLAARAGFPALAVRTAGGMVVAMPPMAPNTYSIIDADCLKFSDAAVSTGGMSRTHRTRVAYWLRDMGAMIDSTGL